MTDDTHIYRHARELIEVFCANVWTRDIGYSIARISGFRPAIFFKQGHNAQYEDEQSILMLSILCSELPYSKHFNFKDYLGALFAVLYNGVIGPRNNLLPQHSRVTSTEWLTFCNTRYYQYFEYLKDKPGSDVMNLCYLPVARQFMINAVRTDDHHRASALAAQLMEITKAIYRVPALFSSPF